MATQTELLRDCNGLAQFNDCAGWLPVRRVSAGHYFTPDGTEIYIGHKPVTFRPLRPDEIVADMASRGDVYIGHLFKAGAA